MDRSTVRTIRDRLNTEIQALAERLGMAISLDPNASYDDDAIHFRLTVVPTAQPGDQSANRQALDFQRYAPLFGLKPTDLGRTFTYGGKPYTLSGLAPKAQRFPVLATNANGKTFKFPVEVLQTLRTQTA